MARWLTWLMDAQNVWVQPFGKFLHGIVYAIFRPIPAIRDLLNGRWLGHPIHAVLTDAPIGILFLVIVFDVVGLPAAAGWALLVGVLAMEDLEGDLRRALIALVAGDDASIGIRGEHLLDWEQPRREGRLARSSRADEHDEARFREVDRHACWRRASQPPPSRARTS